MMGRHVLGVMPVVVVSTRRGLDFLMTGGSRTRRLRVRKGCPGPPGTWSGGLPDVRAAVYDVTASGRLGAAGG